MILELHIKNVIQFPFMVEIQIMIYPFPFPEYLAEY